MAEALWRLRGGRTRLLTAVGDDADGCYLADIAPGLLLDGCIIKKSRTPSYAAVLDQKGECLLGLGDMTLHNHITVDLVNQHMGVLEQAPLVVVDGNLPQETMNHVLKTCHRMQKPRNKDNEAGNEFHSFAVRIINVEANHFEQAGVFFEPTDRRKATKALRQKEGVIWSSPNLSELRAMAKYLYPNSSISETKDLTEILALSKIVSQVIDLIIVTVGSKGVVVIKNDKSVSQKALVAKYFSVEALSQVENVSGAGDCFASGFIHGMLAGFNESCCVFLGFESAKQALFCKTTVPTDLFVNTPINGSEYIMFKTKQ